MGGLSGRWPRSRPCRWRYEDTARSRTLPSNKCRRKSGTFARRCKDDPRARLLKASPQYRDKATMLDAAVKALSQITSPPLRSILLRSTGLPLLLITVLAIGLQRLLSWFATSGTGWAEAMLGPGFQTPLNVLALIVSIAPPLPLLFR